jgi:hypothetical protein
MFDSRNMSKAEKNKWFERFFWISIVVGCLLIFAVVLLGLWMGVSLMYFHEKPKDVDVGVAIATGALALFTALLWFAAALTARFARTEISTSTAVNSADLTLQLDNRFNSDRALRIRHGAVRFFAKKRDVHIDCEHNISPYFAHPDNDWHGLTSDLIDLFNYFDWIGYLTSEESEAIDREVLRRRLGPWIINYYDMCRAEIDDVQEHHPDRWIYLEPLYKHLIDKQKKWFADHKEPLPRFDEDEERANFLQREHVRSHRGFHPPPSGSQSLRQNSWPGSEAF